jgi:hypothetical protein
MMDAILVTGRAIIDNPQLLAPVAIFISILLTFVVYKHFPTSQRETHGDTRRRSSRHRSRERPPHTSRADIQQVYDALSETHAAFFEESDDEEEDVGEKGARLDQLLLDAMETVKPWLNREPASEN